MSIGSCINRKSLEYQLILANYNGDEAAADAYFLNMEITGSIGDPGMFNFDNPDLDNLFETSKIMESTANDVNKIKDVTDLTKEQKENTNSLIEKIELNLKKQLSVLKGQKFKSKTQVVSKLNTLIDKITVEKLDEEIDTVEQIKAIEIFVKATLENFRQQKKNFESWTVIANNENLKDEAKKNLIKDFSNVLALVNNHTILDEIDKSDIEQFFSNKKTNTQMGGPISEMTPQAMITEAIAIRDKIKKDINNYSIPLLADFFLKYKPGYGDAKTLDQIETIDRRIDDVRNNPKNDPNFISKRVKELELEKSKWQAFTLDKKTLVENLKSTNNDESFMHFLFDPLISSKDNVIALFAKAIKSEMETARLKDIKIKNDLVNNVLKQYFKSLSNAAILKTTSLKNLYEGIYEEINTYEDNPLYDENIEGSEKKSLLKRLAFVQKYDINKYNTERYKFFKDLGKKPTEALALVAYKNKKNKWYKENTTTVDQSIIDDAIAEQNSDLLKGDITTEQYNKFLAEIDFNPKFKRPSDKYLNENWKKLYDTNGNPKNEKGKLHKGLTDLYFKQQELLPKDKQPGYFAPSIAKSGNERIENLSFSGVKQSIKETFSVQNYEDDFGNLTENSAIAGEGYKNLPVYYTSAMPTDIISYDLASSVLQFSAMTNKFKALNDINDEVNLFKNALGDRVIEKTDSSGQNVLDSFAKKLGYVIPVTAKGQFDNNSKAHVNAFIDMIIFGESQQTAPFELFGKKFDTGKLTNLALSYSALTSIAMDLLKGVANNLQGNIQLIIEASSGEFFNGKDLAKGKKDFAANSVGAFIDFNRMTPESFQGKLVELFDPMQGDFVDQYGKVVSASTARKLFSTDTLFFNQHFGEYEIAVSNMYALMHATKVYDIESKTVIDLFEAYKKYDVDSLEGKVDILILDANNKPQMDGEEYVRLPFTEERRQDFQNRLHALSKRMQGVYNKFDKSTFQKYSLGRLLLMYRKHLVPGYKRRFKKLSYDIELDSATQGFYNVFFKTMISDLFKFKFNVIKNWSTYSAFEKANIKRALAELSIIISLLIILAFLTGDDDDDEKGYGMNFLIYELTRMRTETFSYINPVDAYRQVRSPSAMLTTFNRLIKFIGQLYSPTEVYERDSGVALKGDNKAWVYFKRLMGISGYNLNPEEATKLYNSISQR